MTGAVTEKVIRERLEESGELGKMRAMVVDAALKALSRGHVTTDLFLPSSTLKEVKELPDGLRALSIVADYLEHLGLTYTVSVLKQEASLVEGSLEDRMSISRSFGYSETQKPILTQLLELNMGIGGTSSISAGVAKLPSAAVFSPPSINVPTPTNAAAVSATLKKDEGEDTTYFISKWTDKTFFRSGGQVSGQQIQLEYLNNCTVYVLDPLDSITVDDCDGGELIVAACEGSIFLRNCKNMAVHVACKQLRTRDCEDVTFHIFASTDPVIESSHHIYFKPFHLRLPGLKSSFKAARLDPKMNRFVHVYDFTEDDKSLPKPHFKILYPDHGLQITDRCKEKGQPECPPEIEDLLESRLAPAASSESGQNKSYDIKAGANKWAESDTVSDKDDFSDEYNERSGKVAPPAASAAAAASARPPLAALTAKTAAAASANQEVDSYSSFDDDDDGDDDDQDDALGVDEDDDDF